MALCGHRPQCSGCSSCVELERVVERALALIGSCERKMSGEGSYCCPAWSTVQWSAYRLVKCFFLICHRWNRIGRTQPISTPTA